MPHCGIPLFEGRQIPVKGAPNILVIADINIIHINHAMIIIKSLYFLDFSGKTQLLH